ncbi:hypothetical protein PMI16_00553 [Herbaspirillum sp. CF444]|uniref:hypothetical protein n=1 Tax=Herbaspirillum sp. CF444 TaxID=1144319 RepID=UPI0002727E16|nr:hypothetical protein [Herbaspirillum sp. CF444]EJL93503.1 hypothetical protein PMI16_00553 [Herbaspirillum sp. CF444]
MKTQHAKVDSGPRKLAGNPTTAAVEELRRRFEQAKGVSSLKDLLTVKYDGPEVSGKN